MDELIFFAVIIFFSIVESIARTRKAKRSKAEAPEERTSERQGLPGPAEWEAPSLPTYDEEPSYDDHVEREPAEVRGHRGGGGREGASSSDVLLPGDLLEELERLAGRRSDQGGPGLPPSEPRESAGSRGTVRRGPATLPEPARSPGGATRPEWVEARPPAPVVPPPMPAPRAPHRIHRSHAGYGTDPSTRAPSEQDGLDPLAETLGKDARAVRDQLRSSSGSALRQAIILQEVLGPPVTLRDEEEA